MKKYKLLKDLPLAKAGTVVTLRKSTDASNIFNENNDRMYAIIDNTDINEWLEEIIEKPKFVWSLKKGDECYSIISEDKVDTFYWEYDSDTEILRNIGWLFISREEAKKEIKKRKAIQKIKKYCWKNNIDTEYEEERNDKLFYIEIDGEFEDQINTDSFPPVFSPIGYFSHENAQKILDNFEEELKIILN